MADDRGHTDDASDTSSSSFDPTHVIIPVVMGAAEAVLAAIEPYYNKRPQHTSSLTGLQWVDELIEGHPDRIKTAFGMRTRVFKLLLKALHKMGYRDSKHVKLREQLAIFLYTCVTGLTIRHVRERFQRPTTTISKYVLYHLFLALSHHAQVLSQNAHRLFDTSVLHEVCVSTEDDCRLPT